MENKQRLRKSALNADLPYETVKVAEWGGNTYGVRGMSLVESNAFVKSVSGDDGVDTDKMHVQILIRTVVDPETNEPVFEQSDAQTLADGPRPTEALRVALQLAGLGGDEQLDEVVQDLEGTPDVGTS